MAAASNAPDAAPNRAARFWLSARVNCCCAAATARGSPEACAVASAARASSTARPADEYARTACVPAAPAASRPEYVPSFADTFCRRVAVAPAIEPIPDATALPMLASPPNRFPLRMLATPCSERAAELARLATLLATLGPFAKEPAPAPTTPAAAVAMPRMLFDLIA